MLSARSLAMRYPGVQALAGVDFDLRAGEIHALCGENGAGKSTLVKILGGVIPHGSHQGELTLRGLPCRFAGPSDALRAGIRVIHQELALCLDLTVAENICLGSEPVRRGLLDARRMEADARAALARLGLAELDPGLRAGLLPVGLRQMVEIARALREPDREKSGKDGGRRGRVLILDEPTSALSAREAARLEETLHSLRAEGYALLYISHRLDEVFRLADRITVLRNGRSAGTLGRREFDPRRVVALMAGDEADQAAPPASAAEPAARAASFGSPILSVRNWTVPSPDNPDKLVLEDLSFDLRAGEILGLAGLMGSGRTELAESLCGLFPVRGRGSVLLQGKPYRPRDARRALDRGLALLGEDRRRHGLLPDESVRANLTCASLKDYCAAGWLVRGSAERRAAREQIERLRIRAPHAETAITALSGGNQQKALLARCLLTRPTVLILDEPTRGVDVGAKAEIHRLVRSVAAAGTGVLLISSELEEVLGLADRVLVLRAGQLAAERRAAELDLRETLALASGAAAAEAA